MYKGLCENVHHTALFIFQEIDLSAAVQGLIFAPH